MSHPPDNLGCWLYSRLKTFAVLLLCILFFTRANAADLFEVSATTTDAGPPLTVNAGSSSILDLVDALINNTDGFTSLNGRNYEAFLRYGTMHDAIRFTVVGNQAFLDSDVAGIHQVFGTGSTSRAQTEAEIENYLKENAQSDLAKFLKAVSANSTVAVTDGNPNSSTAVFAGQVFNDYAFAPGETRAEKDDPESSSSRVGFGFMGDVGTFDSKGIKGTSFSLPLYAKFKLTDRVGLGLTIPLNYTEIEGAQVFGGGLTLAVPIKVLQRSENNPLSWQLTPFGGALATASYDMLAGGVLGQFGFSSMLAYDFDNFTLSMGNYVGLFESVPVTIGDVEYDPNISQQIFKNGLKVSIPFKQHWVFELYAIHTKFLAAAAVDQYFTVGGELGWRPNPKKRRYWKIGLYSDVSGEFTSTHAQFGTAWKF